MFSWFKKKKPLLSDLLPDKLPEISQEDDLNLMGDLPDLEDNVPKTDPYSYITICFNKEGLLSFDCDCIPGKESDFATVFMSLNKGMFTQQLFACIQNLPESQISKIDKFLNKRAKEYQAREDAPVVSPLNALQNMNNGGQSHDRNQ